MNNTQKLCVTCSQLKPISDFYKDRGRCKICYKKQVKDITIKKYSSIDFDANYFDVKNNSNELLKYIKSKLDNQDSMSNLITQLNDKIDHQDDVINQLKDMIKHLLDLTYKQEITLTNLQATFKDCMLNLTKSQLENLDLNVNIDQSKEKENENTLDKKTKTNSAPVTGLYRSNAVNNKIKHSDRIVQNIETL